ncbi:MAG: hypothetical protein K2Y42_10250 [Hyphomicrobium sp.]|jgi:hypothetical protein|uniref:hypothetical protein n=1 Tax=Hyphomicrobium sp. TaxID=82 RepID=UPI0025BAFECE|nr:hypothetical protein [Hyphomicrobium sp.]MBX9863120.1 hypothetical protein [Hyphomicrobium sp.]
MTMWQVRAERAIVSLSRGLRLLAISGAAAMVFFAMFAFILWDVDPMEGRRRLEQWRLAWFGSGSDVTAGDGVHFIAREVDGIAFRTGVKNLGGVELRHCYAWRNSEGRPDQIVQLAQGGGVAGSPLVIWNDDITDQQSGIFGKSPEALISVAKRGCVFEGASDDQF